MMPLSWLLGSIASCLKLEIGNNFCFFNHFSTRARTQGFVFTRQPSSHRAKSPTEEIGKDSEVFSSSSLIDFFFPARSNLPVYKNISSGAVLCSSGGLLCPLLPVSLVDFIFPLLYPFISLRS